MLFVSVPRVHVAFTGYFVVCCVSTFPDSQFTPFTVTRSHGRLLRLPFYVCVCVATTLILRLRLLFVPVITHRLFRFHTALFVSYVFFFPVWLPDSARRVAITRLHARVLPVVGLRDVCCFLHCRYRFVVA